MTRHPGARRVHRSANDDDAFVAGVLESSAWARTHATQLIIGVLAAVILISVFVYMKATSARASQEAAIELDRVRATVQSGNVQLARQDVEGFLAKYRRTPSAREARLMLGQLQLQSGEYQAAVATLRPIADDMESSMEYNAALMMAAAYQANNQTDEAVRVYLRVADRARFDYQTREALELAAKLRAETGNTAGAIQLYERILASFDPEPLINPERSVYEMRLAELRAAAATS